jgi:hypothetical protein
MERDFVEVGDGLLEIEVLSGRPQGEDLFPLPKKFFIRPALIIQIHFKTPSPQRARRAQRIISRIKIQKTKNKART